MDRSLLVQKGDILFAKLNFSYQTQVAGNVSITIYGSEDLGHGLSTSIPLVTYTVEFSHPVLTSFTAVDEFDHAFLKAQPAPPRPQGNPKIIIIDYDDSMQFYYEPVHYRYLLTAPFAGIADIYANFAENTKELKFVSGRNINCDGMASSNSFETNLGFCIRFSNENPVTAATEFPLIGWRISN